MVFFGGLNLVISQQEAEQKREKIPFVVCPVEVQSILVNKCWYFFLLVASIKRMVTVKATWRPSFLKWKHLAHSQVSKGVYATYMVFRQKETYTQRTCRSDTWLRWQHRRCLFVSWRREKVEVCCHVAVGTGGVTFYFYSGFRESTGAY